MIFDNESVEKLRSLIKGFLSEKRYAHTIGVEKMARRLGEMLIPDRVDELSVAALLHDVAKELSYEEHLSLLEGSDVSYTEDDLSVRPALHAIAAVPLIRRVFAEYATADVLSAVANHTLGAANMSVFDEIIFISDYAEEGRTYPACIEVRNFLIESISREKTLNENISALHKASLRATESTIESIALRNEKVNPRTFATKRYLEDLI